MNSFFFLIYFIFLFLALLGLCCHAGFAPVAAKGTTLLVAMHGLLIVVTSLVAHGLKGGWAR